MWRWIRIFFWPSVWKHSGILLWGQRDWHNSGLSSTQCNLFSDVPHLLYNSVALSFAAWKVSSSFIQTVLWGVHLYQWETGCVANLCKVYKGSHDSWSLLYMSCALYSRCRSWHPIRATVALHKVADLMTAVRNTVTVNTSCSMLQGTWAISMQMQA